MAKTRATGADCQLLGAFETTYGAGKDGSGGGVYKSLNFKTTSLSPESSLGEDPLLGQGRDGQAPYYEPESTTGDIEVPVDLRDIGFWLKGVFGDPDTTGASAPYTHVFDSGDVLPSLVLDEGHLQLSPKRVFNIKGIKLGSLAFSMQRSGPLNATISAIAQGESEGTAVADASPIVSALKRFSQGKGSIKSGGVQVAAITGGSFNYSNSLEAIETIRDDGLIDGIDEGEAKATGNAEIRWGKKSAMENAADSESPVSLEYAFTMAGGYSFKFEMPEVYFSKPKRQIDGPAGIQTTHDWQAAKNAAAGYMLRVTLVNDIDGY